MGSLKPHEGAFAKLAMEPDFGGANFKVQTSRTKRCGANQVEALMNATAGVGSNLQL